MQRRLACCDYSGWKFSEKLYFRAMGRGQVPGTLSPTVDICDAQVTSTISSHLLSAQRACSYTPQSPSYKYSLIDV